MTKWKPAVSERRRGSLGYIIKFCTPSKINASANMDKSKNSVE